MLCSKTIKNCSIYYNCLYPCLPTHTQSYKYPFIFTFLVILPIGDMLKVIWGPFISRNAWALPSTHTSSIRVRRATRLEKKKKTIKLLLVEYSLYWLSNWIKDQTIKCLRALDRHPSIFPKSRLSSIIDLIAEAKIQALCTTHCLHPSLRSPTFSPKAAQFCLSILLSKLSCPHLPGCFIPGD